MSSNWATWKAICSGCSPAAPKKCRSKGREFGGGHGVFSYYVIKGLEGAADENHDGVVDANELIKYVNDSVPMATDNKQHPREFGTYDNTMRLSDVKKPGINLAHWRIILDARSGQPLYLASTSMSGLPFDQQASDEVDRFASAINAGRILPEQPDNAFDALQRLQNQLDPNQYQERKNQLQVALENKAQEVLLRYLAGDQMPQSRSDFEQAQPLYGSSAHG